MSLSQVEKEIEKLQKELLDCNQERKKEIESQIKKQEEYYQHLSPYDHVFLLEKVHDQILKIISIISLMILLNYMEIV